MIRDRVKDKIEKSLDKSSDFSIAKSFDLIQRPTSADFGDFSTNVVKVMGDNHLAKELAEKISEYSEIEKVEEKNGFVNIFLKPEVWQKELKDILDKRENYSVLNLGREKTVNVEFVSANPTGELHIGNGRGVFFGDALSNVLEKFGYNVTREYWVNNAPVSVQIQELGKTALGQGESYLTDYLKDVIKELQPELENIKDFSQAGKIVAGRVIKDIQKLIQEKMGVKIDKWFSEENLFQTGQVDAVLDKVSTYKKDDAVWVKTSELGDDEDRVVIRSNGQPGYFLSDIAYHLDKAKRADLIIDIWGADHQGHVKRMVAVADSLDFKKKLQILITQMVNLKESGESKKMSKRSGDLVTLEWLIDEVGVDASRFFYLSKSLNTHIDFDIALAKEQSKKNPVFYVQYSYARSHQIFEKANSGKHPVLDKKTPGVEEKADLSLLTNPDELALIKKLSQWPELIEDIVNGYSKSKSYDVHKITTYATELSADFHKFYEKTKVLVGDDELRGARLTLVRGYQIVLKDVLDVLGVNAPEKM